MVTIRAIIYMCALLVCEDKQSCAACNALRHLGQEAVKVTVRLLIWPALSFCGRK